MCHPSVPGKKDAEADRNFDTLDLPKRTEAAKGEWIEAELGGQAQCWPLSRPGRPGVGGSGIQRD